MMMMLVSEIQDKSKNLVKFFREESIDIIHYNSPIKALDNLQEIAPDAVVIDTVDFPRHWKVITQYLRYDTSKNDVVVILIVNDFFSALEADKALKAGVQGIVNVDNPSDNIVKNAENILAKYKSSAFRRKGRGVKGSCLSDNECSFLFVEPTTGSIVTGRVKDINEESLLFIPDSQVENLEVGTVLSNCSLKLGNTILTPKMHVVELANYINLEFDASEEDMQVISSFVKKYSQ